VREAILSDIHGNLEALLAVAEAAARASAGAVHFVGDAVGYGPDPEECSRWVERNAALKVAGNHDFAAVGAADPGGFNALARAAMDWTTRELSPGSVRFLSRLPLVAEEGGIKLVHANPRLPAEWGYIMTLWDADVNFGYFTGAFCFVGHSHQPVMVKRDPAGTVSVVPGTSLKVEEGCRYLINVGSVGQPRDRNPEACMGILDRERGEFSFLRVPYDYTVTQAKMRRAGLPEPLGARLAEGR